MLNSFAGSDLEKIPKMLLGNKSDLDIDRKVKYEEGYAFNEKKGISFFETSPKDGWGVDDAYEIFLDNVKKGLNDLEFLIVNHAFSSCLSAAARAAKGSGFIAFEEESI